MRVLYSFYILILLVHSKPLAAQTHRYEITWAGATIGVMQATRSTHDSLTTYKLESEVNFWFFKRIRVVYHLISVYRGQQLLFNQVVTKSTKGNFKTTTQWNAQKSVYEVQARAYEYSKDTVLTTAVSFNVGRLYFEEPIHQKVILADAYGVLVPLDKSSGHQYTMVMRGKKNKFYYHQGKMIRASMYSPIRNYEIRLVEKTEW